MKKYILRCFCLIIFSFLIYYVFFFIFNIIIALLTGNTNIQIGYNNKIINEYMFKSKKIINIKFNIGLLLFLSTIMPSIVTSLFFLLMTFKFYKKDDKYKFNFNKLKLDYQELKKNSKLILILLFALVFCFLIILIPNDKYKENEPEVIKNNKIITNNFNLFNVLLIIVLYIILLLNIALGEEYFFRYVYFKLFKLKNKLINLLLNSFIFSFFHIFRLISEKNHINNLGNLIPIFLFSFVFLSFIYFETDNLFIVLIIHFLYDFVLLLRETLLIQFFNIFDKLIINIKFLNFIIYKNTFLYFISIFLIFFFINKFMLKDSFVEPL